MSKQTLSEHLVELRKRLLISFLVFIGFFTLCYFYVENIYAFLLKPLNDIYIGQTGRKLIFTGLTEAFFTYLKLASFAAFFCSLPFIIWQFYKFISPGLYKKERRIFWRIFASSPLLFIAGSSLCYYAIFPAAWKFFISFETKGGDLPILLEARISEYLSLSTHLILAFGLAFQLPIIIALLAKTGLVSYELLASKRKYALVIILIIAAIITPPDIISQIGLALPMVALYELGVFISKRIQKQSKNA
jgi:sec-independent protein translocase protein TatC